MSHETCSAFGYPVLSDRRTLDAQSRPVSREGAENASQLVRATLADQRLVGIAGDTRSLAPPSPPEPPPLRRIHSGSALQGQGTEASAWLDPNARRRSRFVERSTFPVLREILRSVHRHPASVAERAEIEVAVSAAWIARRIRVNGGLVKLWLRSLARKTA